MQHDLDTRHVPSAGTAASPVPALVTLAAELGAKPRGHTD